jgi:hypothetical protein
MPDWLAVTKKKNQVKYLSIILLITLLNSCSFENQSKPINTEPEKVNLKAHKYGAGDVVYKAYLDNIGNMWFATFH